MTINLNSNSTFSLSVLLSTLTLILMGCSTTSETFDCKAGQGVGCKSISEINHMVDQGTLGSSAETRMLETHLPEKGTHPRSLPFSGPHVSNPVISSDHSIVDDSENKRTSLLSEISLSDTLSVRRIPEQYMRVWIAPYQDGRGNLHEGSIVHTIVKPSHWQMSPSERQPIPPTSSGLSTKKIDVPDDNEISLEEDD